MPLLAYFRNIGALLLALIFLADFCFPKADAVRQAKVYPPTIRIHSEPKWPERLVFDTSQTSTTSGGSADSSIAIASLPDPVQARATQTQAPQTQASAIRDALALMPQRDIRPPARSDQHKRQRKAHYRVTRSNRYARPPAMFAIRQSQFAWFGFPQWR